MAEILTRWRTTRRAAEDEQAAGPPQQRRRWLVLRAAVLHVVRQSAAGLSVGELVKELGVGSPAVVNAAKALQRAGLLAMTKSKGRLLIRARGES